MEIIYISILSNTGESQKWDTFMLQDVVAEFQSTLIELL